VLSAIQSVNGPIAVDQLGVVMPHEHTFIDLLREYRGNGLINDPELVCDELVRFREAGGSTLVDLTARGLHPEPELNRRVAADSGVNVIMGTGFYRTPYLDLDWFERHSIDEVADVLIRDIEEGIDGTGVRAGIIGEIGCDRAFTAAEEKSFRAAARAQQATDVTISTHAARWPVGLAQLDLLESEGVPAGRVIIGHSDMVPDRDYHRAICERGAWVEFDTIAPGNEYYLERTVRAIHALVDAGFASRILLSQDVCLDSHLEACGGSGYGYILRSFNGRLEATGLAPSLVRAFVTDNPARALSGA
jgi:predicted metal-dependent phosphotriesterase family hydrolase